MCWRQSIYPYEKRLFTTEKRIENSEISKRNKELLFEFRDFLILQGVKAPRVEKHLDNLERVLRWLKKDADKVTKRDIEAIVARINRSRVISDWTKYDYRRSIKAFWIWLGMEEVVKDIKNPTPKLDLPKEILSEDEIKKMIDSCENVRDKAIIAVLYESGARIGEFLNLKIRDVTFDEYGAVIKVSGKTGDRRIRIVSSIPYLVRYLDIHPRKDDPDAPLWVKVWYPGKGEPVDYDTIAKQLKKIAKRAGIKKRVHPHLFRHSRATHLANYLTEAQMCEFFGWVQGSDMPRIYIHLSGRDVDEAILRMYGLLRKEDTKPKMGAKFCPRCNAVNEEEARFCMRCGLPLTEDAQIDAIAEELLIREFSDALLSDEIFRQVLQRLKPFIMQILRGEIEKRMKSKSVD